MLYPHRYINLCLLAIVLLCNTLSVAADVVIHDLVFSNLDALINIDDSATTGTSKLTPFTLQFSAMGRDINLQLQASRFNKIATQHDLPSALLPQLYQGTINGDVSSWARISVYGDTISGTIFYAGKLLQLDSRANAISLSKNHSNTEFVLIEPATSVDANHLLRGFYGATDHVSFAPIDTPDDSPDLTHLNANSRATTHADTVGTNVTRAMRIGIVIDSRFNEAHRNRGLARALSIIHSVDAIYQTQLGIALIIDGIRVYDDPTTDPLRNTFGTVNQILESYRNLRLNDEQLPNDLTLVHLFTGHRDPNRVIGLGWLNTACRLDGYDLSMSTPFPFDTLLAAHEIAHNLGALHDDYPQCLADNVDQSNTLMKPAISGSSTSVFSNCSTRYMQAAKNASCNLENIDASIGLHSYPTNNTLRRSVFIEVENKDQIGRAIEIVSKTDFPDDTQIMNVSAGCIVDGTTVTCEHGAVQPGLAHSLSVTAQLPNRSQELVITKIELLNASDIEVRDNRATIQLLQFDTSSGEPVAGSSQRQTLNDESAMSKSQPTGIGNTSLASLMMLLCGFTWRSSLALKLTHYA